MCKVILFTVLCLVCVQFGYSDQNVQLAPERSARLLQNALQCISETGVDPGILYQVRKRQYTDDENIKKFFLCAFRKTGVSTKKGIVNTDKLLEIYPDKVNKEELRKVVEACKDQDSSEPMDRVYNFFKCYQEKTPVHITLRN